MRRFRAPLTELRSVALRPICRMPIAGPETALASIFIAALVVGAMARKIMRPAGR